MTEPQNANQRADLRWALERIKMFDSTKGLMPYQEGMIAMAAEIERLKAMAWKYGKHLTSCRLQQDQRQWCDCGWTKVRETLAPAEPRDG